LRHEVVHIVPQALNGAPFGERAGKGTWTFGEARWRITAIHDRRADPGKQRMRVLSSILRPVFARNRATVMWRRCT
jgi:hypothetical protein